MAAVASAAGAAGGLLAPRAVEDCRPWTPLSRGVLDFSRQRWVIRPLTNLARVGGSNATLSPGSRGRGSRKRHAVRLLSTRAAAAGNRTHADGIPAKGASAAAHRASGFGQGVASVDTTRTAESAAAAAAAAAGGGSTAPVGLHQVGRVGSGADPRMGVVGVGVPLMVAAARGRSRREGRRSVQCHVSKPKRPPKLSADNGPGEAGYWETYGTSPGEGEFGELLRQRYLRRERRRKRELKDELLAEGVPRVDDDDLDEYQRLITLDTLEEMEPHLVEQLRVKGPLPDALSFFSPMVPMGRIEEAKALRMRRAVQRTVDEEKMIEEFVPYEELEKRGEVPMTLVRKGPEEYRENPEPPTEMRPVTKEEYNRFHERKLNMIAKAEATYPQVLAREPKLDKGRIREKLGLRPKVDGKMSWVEFQQNMGDGAIGRVLQYDEGRTIIAEMCPPGWEMASPAVKQYFEVQVPGDAQWRVTKMAYMNRSEKRPYDKPLEKAATSQFMHLPRTTETFAKLAPYTGPMIFLWFLCGWFSDNDLPKPKRKKENLKKNQVFKWVNKNIFQGRLSKKAPQKDMMEEFGKSKAKMIGKDADKDGTYEKLGFKDVAGVDHIVDEFRYIIKVMKEYKEFQETNTETEKKRRKEQTRMVVPEGGFLKNALAKVPKPDSEEFLADPDYVIEVEEPVEDQSELDATRARLSIPKGVLFEGPPGTGKTLLAKAIAGEAGVPFFYANGSEFVEMFVGVAAKRVRDLFKRARDVSPSIIFIDEMDTIGRSRALYSNRDSATAEREAGLMQLLVELDGFDTKAGGENAQEMVLVMGATNLSAQLDPALLRSGRFERSFHVGVPKTHEARLAILKVHAAKLNIPRGGNAKWDEDALLNRTAELTDGYSGASLAALLNEAAILAVRNDRDEVTLDDIEKVIERNLVGVASAPIPDGWGKDHRAMVEAGRAVLWSSKQSMNYCPEVLRVTIKPFGDSTTGVMLVPEKTSEKTSMHFNGEERADTLDDFIDGMAMLLAGRVVETVFFGSQGVSVQTKADLAACADIAYDIANYSGIYPDSSKGIRPIWPEELIEHFSIPRAELDAGVQDLMMRAHIRAEEYVKYYKPVILQVASELLAHGSLYGTHVRNLVEEHHAKKQVEEDEELAKAAERAAEEEDRARRDKAYEEEEAAKRAAQEAAAQEEAAIEAARSKELEDAINVEASDEPLYTDPFGTAAAASEADNAAYSAMLSRALRDITIKPDDQDDKGEATAVAQGPGGGGKGETSFSGNSGSVTFNTEGNVVSESAAPPANEQVVRQATGAMDAEAYAAMLSRALRDIAMRPDEKDDKGDEQEVPKGPGGGNKGEISFSGNSGSVSFSSNEDSAGDPVASESLNPVTAAEVEKEMERAMYRAQLLGMIADKKAAEKNDVGSNEGGDDDDYKAALRRALRT